MSAEKSSDRSNAILAERDDNAAFEEFWKVFDPNQKQPAGVKEWARKMFITGAAYAREHAEN